MHDMCSCVHGRVLTALLTGLPSRSSWCYLSLPVGIISNYYTHLPPVTSPVLRTGLRYLSRYQFRVSVSELLHAS